MTTNLITEYPLWFMIFCIAGGFLYAFLLYRKDKKFEEVSKIVMSFMFALRFISVSIIAFLLLSPFLQTISRTIESPIIIFAQDNSESVFQDKENSKKYNNSIGNLTNELSSKYDLQKYSFGEKIKKEIDYSFSDKETDISELLGEIQNSYYNRNTGALIIASDGIYNKGKNPIYALENFEFPVYTIALGDTGVKKDILISNVKHNKIAFLNNKFPVQAVISAKKLKGEKTEIKIYDKNKLLYSENILIDKNDFFKKINFEIKAENTGIRQLRIVLNEISGELSTKNNLKTIVVEVIDSKQKILILANSPHPDVSAIRQSLSVNQNFETDFYILKDFNKTIKAYNLIILHQIPSVKNSAVNLLSEINKSNIPVLYILGTQTSRRKFDNLQTGIKIGQYNNAFDDVQGKFNKDFSLFELNDEIKSFVADAPPLKSPFGNYRLTGNSDILFYRKIKNIITEQALIIFNPNETLSGGKLAVITGEGLWRWRIYDYQKNQNQYLFNELINKTVQYLTLHINKERFRVNVNKIFPENSDVIFNAELYNKSYELINDADVKLQIRDSLSNKNEYLFNKTRKSYSLNTGIFSPGDYTWNAETIIDGEKKKKSGTFTVTPINIESVNTVANHNLLHQISEKTGGKMYYPNQIDSLFSDIVKNENIVPISFSEKKTESIINLKILFFIILFLLSAEWFIRKFNGSY